MMAVIIWPHLCKAGSLIQVCAGISPPKEIVIFNKHYVADTVFKYFKSVNSFSAHTNLR